MDGVLYPFDFSLSVSGLPSGRQEKWGTDAPQRSCGACLKRWVLPPRGLPSMRWLRLCLRRAASNAQIIRVFILFFNSKKRKQKMPLSCAEGGSAQRKALCGSHTMRWPARWVARRPCALCAMVLSEGLLGWPFCQGFSECLGNVKGIIKKPSHKESKRLKQRSEHPMERNASKLASHKSRATLFVRDS